MDGYSSEMKGFGKEDIISLFLGGIGTNPFLDPTSSVKLQRALAGLEKSVPPDCRKDVKNARERFYFDPEPWWKEKPVIACLDTLRRAVWDTEKLKIVYRKISGEESRRVIRPYGLVVKFQTWYLAAWCETAKEMRIFRCDRITGAELTGEGFTRDEPFDLPAFWKSKDREFRQTAK
jgi:predicted DNA-binding transcriptional regulator YafY